MVTLQLQNACRGFTPVNSEYANSARTGPVVEKGGTTWAYKEGAPIAVHHGVMPMAKYYDIRVVLPIFSAKVVSSPGCRHAGVGSFVEKPHSFALKLQDMFFSHPLVT